MAKDRWIRLCVIVACLMVATIVGAWNAINLQEAFGSGAPYYSRTTNMDKWTDPRLTLAAVDLVALAIVSVGVYWVRRK